MKADIRFVFSDPLALSEPSLKTSPLPAGKALKTVTIQTLPYCLG